MDPVWSVGSWSCQCSWLFSIRLILNFPQKRFVHNINVTTILNHSTFQAYISLFLKQQDLTIALLWNFNKMCGVMRKLCVWVRHCWKPAYEANMHLVLDSRRALCITGCTRLVQQLDVYFNKPFQRKAFNQKYGGELRCVCEGEVGSKHTESFLQQMGWAGLEWSRYKQGDRGEWFSEGWHCGDVIAIVGLEMMIMAKMVQMCSYVCVCFLLTNV